MTRPISSIYFKFISNNWIYIGYYAIAYNILLCILVPFLPESPRFLYDKGEFLEARKVIHRMAQMNKSTLASEKWIFDLEEIRDSEDDNDSPPSESKTLLVDRVVPKIDETEVSIKINPIKMMIKHPRLFINLVIV